VPSGEGPDVDLTGAELVGTTIWGGSGADGKNRARVTSELTS